MKLLFENWRGYIAEEDLVQNLLKEDKALDEGNLRDALKNLKDKFISAVAAGPMKENPLADFIIAYDDNSSETIEYVLKFKRAVLKDLLSFDVALYLCFLIHLN